MSLLNIPIRDKKSLWLYPHNKLFYVRKLTYSITVSSMRLIFTSNILLTDVHSVHRFFILNAMKYISYSLTIFILFMSTTLLQAADIKKWTDEKGHVYYGDTPPLQASTKTIKTNKRPSNIGKPLPRLSTATAQKRATSTPSSAAPDSLDPEQAKEACEAAKKDIAVINKSRRIQLRASDGSLRYMTTEEIQQRRDRSTEEIDKFCR